MNSSEPFRPIAPGVTIGHVHLKVADLERALAFYSGVLGLVYSENLNPGQDFDGVKVINPFL